MNALAGTGRLLRAALRRSRIMLAVWVYALAAIPASNAASFKKLYKDSSDLRGYATGINHNAAALALYGKVRVPDSIGGVASWKVGTTGAALVAVMSILLVIRHTRGDEETGRQELVGACVVGRRAPLTAGLLVGAVANLLLALLAAIALIAVGMPATGSFAFGASWLICGLSFTAVAGVAAQLTETALAARGIAVAALGGAYLLRAVGDASGAEWPAWLSPIGWTERFRAYGAENWWLCGLGALFAIAVTAVAYALVGRRDLGAGLLPARPGRADAAPSLRGSFTLAWRLQRGLLLSWVSGFAVYGAIIGGVLKGIGDLVGDSSGTRKLLEKMGGQQGMENAYIGTVMGILGILAAVYGVQAVLRLRTEETSLRAEPLLATRVRRVSWALGHLAFAVFGTTLALTVTGLAAGLVHGARVHDIGAQVPRLLGAALVQAPAAWIPAGLAMLLFGFAPRLSHVSWAVVGVFLLLGEFGPVLRLGQAVMDLSPFTHVPKLPGSGVSVTPLAALTAVAFAVTAVGLVGLRRRDIG